MAPRKGDDPRLDKYLAKRHFAVTPEPTSGAASEGLPRFVVQQHDATRMHYDVRLEVDGVLVSWAVPRGPSMDPAVKRLAIQTEDHPMDYAGFEGFIPRGEYGGGPVIVWDAGLYHNLTSGRRGGVRPMREAVERGHVKAWLMGEKLQGAWVFQRTGDVADRQWLMIKVQDAAADPALDPVRDDPFSILSGRTVADVEPS
ncbi:MAG TPA: DNA polymerase ligase N-terminal domain-containing protein [Acidimicrobiales bacterium]|nr:DNA polymerase ligase N-terminal domain-containing protein [Acidimicrobiales bacterium]